jgi:hypothetical protein
MFEPKPNSDGKYLQLVAPNPASAAIRLPDLLECRISETGVRADFLKVHTDPHRAAMKLDGGVRIAKNIHPFREVAQRFIQNVIPTVRELAEVKIIGFSLAFLDGIWCTRSTYKVVFMARWCSDVRVLQNHLNIGIIEAVTHEQNRVRQEQSIEGSVKVRSFLPSPKKI